MAKATTPTTTMRRSRSDLATDPRCNFRKFAESFRAAMDRKALSVSQAATEIGVSTSIIYAYERGISRPEGATLLTAEKVLGKLDMSDPLPSQATAAKQTPHVAGAPKADRIVRKFMELAAELRAQGVSIPEFAA